MRELETTIFQNGKEMHWIKWVFARIPWEDHLIGNNIRDQM